MINNTNRKLLFNNLEEYQDEVERLEEIIKNQSILIDKLMKEEPKLRESKIIPIIGGASHIRKTFPKFNSPEYLYHIKHNPLVIHDINEDNYFEKRMTDFTSAKSIGKTFSNLHISLESILDKENNKSLDKPIEELLLMQSKGQTLTKEEKKRCIKYAESVRLKRKKSK